MEVSVVVDRGFGPSRTLREVKQVLGSIPPGKRVKYRLSVTNGYNQTLALRFRAGGKRVEVLNEYAYKHGLDWLDTALGARARYGVWSEHKDSTRWLDWLGPLDVQSWVVHLTAEQVALPGGAREALLRDIARTLRVHRDRFHKGAVSNIRFVAPGGGGWRLEDQGMLVREEAG
jgi:hypothetical protein